ncbi:MAG TPA: WD40 repeat domain-containing protein, partial [Ktedonobacteraceae bacterium]|nr:WD40 repeat domain-containing protein [Ktedonobacteraceae bacterium]
KQELQHLMTQYNAPKKRGFSRRTLFKMGGSLAGLAALATASSWVTWQVEIITQTQMPTTSYSPHLGGTISTYNAQNGVLAVAWSPDGTRLAMGNWNGQIQAWDAKTGHHVINFPGAGFQQVFSLIWLPDGSSIVAGGDNAVVWVWNAATGEVQNKYQSQEGNIQNNDRGHTGVITVASSPDSKYIASGGYDQTVQVWEAATGRLIVIYRGHTGGIGSVTWSPDGRYIASASYDMTVQIWDATTGRLILTYHGHTKEVYAVAWSPNGQHIASGGKDNTVQVWDALTGHTLFSYHGHSMAVQDVAWSPNGSTIASAADNVQLWNSLTGKHIYTYTKHATSITHEVQAVAWSPNGRYIASGGMEGTVQVWNAV